MGEMIMFPANGRTCDGYLTGSGSRGLVVIQEWWGLVPHIKEVADRFAAEGFFCLAPDLYHGKATDEPDEAGKLMMELQFPEARKDMLGAVAELRTRGATKVGATGFCMGGAMTLALASTGQLDAAVPFYGFPQQEPDWSNLRGPVQMHFAEHDDYFSPKAAAELAEKLKAAGKDAELFVYEGTEHAFFNDTRPDVHNAAASKQAWDRALPFLKSHLS